METTFTFNRMREVYREVFKQPSLEIRCTFTAADIQGWDSLTHMLLIDAIEKAFGIEFSFEEITGLQNVGDFVKLVSEKTGK